MLGRDWKWAVGAVVERGGLTQAPIPTNGVSVPYVFRC